MNSELKDKIQEIIALPFNDRLQIMDAIRESLLEDSAPAQLSSEQWAGVRRRVEEMKAHPEIMLTWEEVQAKMKELG